MQRGFTKEGLLKHSPSLGTGQGVAAPGEGIVMITGTGIIGGGVAAGVTIGMKGIGIVEEKENLVAEVGAVVQVLITTRVVEGIAMMMSVVAIAEAEADLWIVAPLHAAALVLEGVLHLKGVLPLKEVFPQGGAQGMKALRVVAVMDDLLHLTVSHHVVNPRIREAHPLEILMEMNEHQVSDEKMRRDLE